MAYSSTKPANGTSLVSADIRENFRALKEDGIVVATDASITQSKLKTSQGSVSIAGGSASNLTLPGGEYGFYPQTKGCASLPTYSVQVSAQIVSLSAATTYTTYIYLTATQLAGSGGSAYAQQRYVTSSGEVFWVFILRDKITKDIISMYQAPDHPCFGNGGKPSVVQHPFGSYDPETQEIIVINPSENEVTEMKGKCEKGEDEPDKDLLEIITEEYEIDENSAPKWPTKEVTVGLPKDHDWKRDPDDTKVTPIKKVIPRPDGILCKSLKKKRRK